MAALHKALVQNDGIYCNGTWYYHKDILVKMGQECLVEKTGLGERVNIYDLEGERWDGQAQAVVTVSVKPLRKFKQVNNRR